MVSPFPSVIFPSGFTFLQKSFKTLHGVMGFHQLVEIDLLDGFEPLIHVIIEASKSCFLCQSQNDPAQF